MAVTALGIGRVVPAVVLGIGRSAHRAEGDIASRDVAVAPDAEAGIGRPGVPPPPAVEADLPALLLARIGLALVFRIGRPEERRVGKGCGSTCRYRWSPYN